MGLQQARKVTIKGNLWIYSFLKAVYHNSWHLQAAEAMDVKVLEQKIALVHNAYNTNVSQGPCELHSANALVEAVSILSSMHMHYITAVVFYK